MEKRLRFLDMYHAGVMQADEIDDFIDEWHQGGSRVALHVHLGMSWGEYTRWATDNVLPTEQEHALLARQDVVFVGPPEDRQPLHVHGPLRCRPVCPIHWPSDHAMADWPLQWFEDVGVIMRLCHHGFGHPDPDDQQVRLHPELARHDCDGCCRPTIDGEVRAALAQLDGSAESAVALLTGMSRDELSRYGGMSPRQS
jgi:hypothetical protein